ncbi:serine hydrolase domain-containing protein [Shimia sp. SK013]|uniref:serine hydrolase domain-containing protein n=1 Tax=Shimia sp. SK013 TaxID=1389006 RepID=UPI00187CD750|nr:serine hydrolase domain-containing protein [Shimia sp. SK013]
MTILASVIAALPFSTPVYANDAATIAKFDAAWTKWADKVGVRNGAFVVTKNGKIVHRAGRNANTTQPFEMHSLSKAVTGVCVAGLVGAGQVKYSDTVGQILGESVTFKDKRVSQVTVAQLLTHTSGLKPDSTQRDMGKWLGSTKPRHDAVIATVARRKKQQGVPGRFFYSNENYAVLGKIIEVASGRSYLQTCGKYVPGGKASSLTGGFAPWGGWKMSVESYAAFHSKNFGATSKIGRAPSRHANAGLGGGAHYGLGTFWRPSGGRFNFWHFGKHCFRGRLMAGSYAVSWMGKWGVVAAYDVCTSDRQNGALDEAMVAVVYK